MLKYKQNRKLITIKCDYCGKEFEKPVSEYNRNIKLGRSNYCSRHCCGCANIKNLPKNNSSNIKQYCNNRGDKYTPFRYYYRNAKRRFKEFNLTLEYLKELWEKQKGICPYTGIKLNLATYLKNHNDPIFTASLDRIDPSKGYIIGNVQYISTAINYMKHTMSHEDTIKLCQIIAKNIVEVGAYDSAVRMTV